MNLNIKNHNRKGNNIPIRNGKQSLKITTPQVITPYGIEKFNNKFNLGFFLSGNTQELEQFKNDMILIDTKLKEIGETYYTIPPKIWKTPISIKNDNYLLRTKIPFRFNKIETIFYNNCGEQITSSNIIQNSKIIVEFTIPHVWTLDNSFGYYCVCKKITLL